MQKPCDDNLELHIDTEMGIGQAYTTDEAIPILDLRYPGPPMDNGESLNFDGGLHPRRMSGSSLHHVDVGRPVRHALVRGLLGRPSPTPHRSRPSTRRRPTGTR